MKEAKPFLISKRDFGANEEEYSDASEMHPEGESEETLAGS